MLNVELLSRRIAEGRSGHISFGDFEDWFRSESRDAHLWGNEKLVDLVFSVEDVLSQYHFENLRGISLWRELENAIHPFQRNDVVLHLEPSISEWITVFLVRSARSGNSTQIEPYCRGRMPWEFSGSTNALPESVLLPMAQPV